jgi:cation transport ATPase
MPNPFKEPSYYFFPMVRRIITLSELDEDKAAARVAAAPQPDDYTSRILKLIPAEIVAGFLAADAAFNSVTNIPSGELLLVKWITFFALLALTPVYLFRTLSDATLNQKAKKTRNLQILFASGAFVVWVFTLGGPFKDFPWYHSVYGTVMLILYTFLIPLVFKK